MVSVVIGLGEVGKTLLEIIKEKYSDAIGVDINPVDINEEVDVMHVCIPFSNRFSDITINYINKYKPELTIINSTVIPGTTRKLIEQTGSKIVYSPVKGIHKRMKDDMLFYTKFIGGLDKHAMEAAKSHFESLGMKAKCFDNPEAVELMKLMETTYYGLLIAWAQETDRIAKKFNSNYDDIMQFVQEVDKRGLPRPKMIPGYIGGHCVIPNIHLLKKLLDSKFFEAILDSNEKRKQELEVEGIKVDDKKNIAMIKANKDE